MVKNKENYSEIVKDISTCANSQTGIKQSDFESGDKYLIDMEKISKEEISPITNKKLGSLRIAAAFGKQTTANKKTFSGNVAGFKQIYQERLTAPHTPPRKVL
jgi:hypothetical protein